jgi:hypothetical protein
MTSLMAGVPGLADAPSFAEGELQLELRVIPSLDKLPDPADVALPATDLGMASPANRLPLFQTVEAQFIIDRAGTKNPRRAGRQILKHLPASYTDAFAFADRTRFARLG